MKVLVTADRDYKDSFLISVVLEGFLSRCEKANEELVVIQGGAKGGDNLARLWAESHQQEGHPVRSITVKADWDKHGKAAGPIRNRKMYDEHLPDVVVAFHDDLIHSKGTKDMVAYAISKGAYVIHLCRYAMPDLVA